MSALDPRGELQLVLRLANRCDLSEEGRIWIQAVLNPVEHLVHLFEYLDSKGYPVPDEIRIQAFKEIRLRALCYLQNDREIDAFCWVQSSEPDV